MKLIKLLPLIFLLSCVSNPHSELTGNNIAVTVEGLGSISNLEKHYTKPLEQKGYKVYNLNWKYNKFIKAKVCLTHSCGFEVVQKGAECETLITFDARNCDLKDKNEENKKPKGVGKLYNFYQESGLRGYPVIGADTNTNKGRIGHLTLPKACLNEVLPLIEEAK